MDKSTRIFVGAYGSGKTEVALNYAFQRAARGRAVGVADLDLVNPYFRSRELREQLEARGIQVAAPEGELADADLPIVTGQVRTFLQDPDLDVVLDVGGDDAGSRALSSFAPLIQGQPHQAYMVINDRRPWTGETEGIAESIARVEGSARLRVTAIVSNPNLSMETTRAVVERGHEVIAEAARQLELPVAMLCVMGALADELGPTHEGVPVMRLERHLAPPWYEDSLRFAPVRDQRGRVMREQIRARELAARGGTQDKNRQSPWRRNIPHGKQDRS